MILHLFNFASFFLSINVLWVKEGGNPYMREVNNLIFMLTWSGLHFIYTLQLNVDLY